MTTKRTKVFRTTKAGWVRRPRGMGHFWERPSTAERKYREYHDLENTVARIKAAQDAQRMKKIYRSDGRLDLILERNRYYLGIKAKRQESRKTEA